jgi:membrane protease YdiL (CAAX protease family)
VPASRSLLLLLVLGVLGAAVFLCFHRDAFPYASLSLTVGGKEARRAAEVFLRERGINLDGYLVGISFEDDERAREFLERTLGSRQANELMRDRINAWHWKVRFFRSFQKEELEVDVDPGGKLVGFEHTLPEDAGGGDAGDSARKKAWSFLEPLVPGPVRSALRTSDARERILPHRTDRSFSWKRSFPEFPSLDYMYEVVVAGSRVSSYREYLRVPEYFVRLRDQEAGRGELLTQIAGFLTFLFAISVVLVMMRRHSGGDTGLRVALILGLSVFLLTAVHGANSWPLYFSRYDTSNTLPSHMAFAYLALLLEGLLSAFVVVYAATLGSRLERETPRARAAEGPPLLSFRQLFTMRGLLSASSSLAVAAGGLGAAAVLGWQTVFYLLGRKWLGAYVPAEVPWSDILSTAMPWVYPLIIGFTAAMTEELLFRLMGVSFFRRLAGNVAGLLIPAALWAFMHCNYPQQPYWIRGVELTAVGFFWGWLYLRFGILASLTAHYLFNSFLGAMLLITAGSTALRFAGALVVCLPLMIPLLRLAAGRPSYEEADGICEPASIDESHAPVPPQEPVASIRESVPPPLSRTKRLALLLLGALGFLVAIFWPAPRLGASEPSRINRMQAVSIAAETLRARGVALEGMHLVATYRRNLDFYQARYLVRALGTRQTARFLDGRVPVNLWYVRAFRSARRTEHLVKLTGDGAIFSYNLIIPEDEPGAALPSAEALEKARSYLEGCVKRGRGDSGWDLVESIAHRRRNRIDYDFRFECPSVRAGQAVLRADVQMKGGEVLNYYPYFKLPEDLLRVQKGHRLGDVLIAALFLLAGLYVFIRSLKLLAGTLRSSPGRLSLAMRVAIAPAALQLLGRFVTWPDVLFEYETVQALPSYTLSQILALSTSALFTYFTALWLLLSLDALFKKMNETSQGPFEILLSFSDPARRIDTLILGYGCCGIFLGSVEASIYLREALARSIMAPVFYSPPFADAYAPALAVLGVTLPQQLLLLSAGGMIVLFLALPAHKLLWRFIIPAAALAAFAYLTTRTPQEFVGSFVFLLLAAVFLAGMARIFLGARAAAWLVLYLLISLLSMAVQMIASGDLFLSLNGAFLIALALTPTVLPRILSDRGP